MLSSKGNIVNNADDIRKEFDEWARKNAPEIYLGRSRFGCYLDENTSKFYKTWQAAIESTAARIDELEAAITSRELGRKDAERWNFVMMTSNYCMALFKALPKEIYEAHRHINNAIDAAIALSKGQKSE